MKTQIILASIPIAILLAVTTLFSNSSVAEETIIASASESSVTTTQAKLPLIIIKQPITTTIEKTLSSVIEQSIDSSITSQTLTTLEKILEQETTAITYTTTIAENSILLPNKARVKIDVMPTTQENVNTHNIVLDNQDFSTKQNLLLFRHVHNTFKVVDDIKLDDEIAFCLNGVQKNFQVVISEEGQLNSNNTDIITKDRESLLYSPTNAEITIRLITCRPILLTQTTLDEL